MTRTEWLLAKKKVITSTDPAILLGLGFQNQSVEKLYQFKTSETLEEDEPSELMELGTYLEPYIDALAKKYIQEKDGVPECNWVRDVYTLRYSPTNTWQATSIDLYRVFASKLFICETKCVFGYPSSDWGPSGTDLIPEKYIIQCQHQMGVLELEEMYLAALFVSSGEFRMYKIRFKPSLFALISYVEEVFWDIVQNRYGLQGWPDFISNYLPSIREYTPKIQEGTRIALDSEGESLIINYIQAVDIWSQMEEEAGSLREQIVKIMGDAEIGETEKYLVKRPLVKTKKPYRKFVVESKENAS